MAKRLTYKEKGFVKDLVKGKTGTQAALDNYDTESYMTAANIASVNLNKPKIVKALEDALPDDILFEIHREGLYATREYFNSKGEMQGDVADFSVRHKYLDTAYKLKGKYEDSNKPSTTNNFTQIVIHTSKDAKDSEHISNS